VIIAGEWSPEVFNFEKTASEIISNPRETDFALWEADFTSREVIFRSREAVFKYREVIFRFRETVFTSREVNFTFREMDFISRKVDFKARETVFKSREDFLKFCPDASFICRFLYSVRALKRCVRARQTANHIPYAICFALPDDSSLPGQDAVLFRLLPNGKLDFA
jgi:hypothetical protein